MLCLEGAASSKVFLVLLSNIPTQLNSLHSCIIKSVATQVASMTSMQAKIIQTLLCLVNLGGMIQLKMKTNTLISTLSFIQWQILMNMS